MKYNSLQIKNVLWSLLILGLSATFGACSEDKTYEPLGEAAILTEVKLNVTDPLRLLVGTDSLISYSFLRIMRQLKNWYGHQMMKRLHR